MTNPENENPGLKTLDEGGKVPETRLGKAEDARALVEKLVQADNNGRSRKRALVKGLVDGNPPYRAGALKAAGRADACNVNWRIAESYLNQAVGAFYDVFSEVPTFATVTTDYGNVERRQEWSGILTEEFDRLQKKEKGFDYTMQNSQGEMVLYGVGPLMFPDKYDWRCESVKCQDLLVMENTKSDTHKWELCVVRRPYLCHELYAFIANPEAAAKIGWDVEYTKQCIMMAHPKYAQGGIYLNWEWHQQQLKNSAYYYSMDAKTIEVAHIYFKEFPTSDDPIGKISHVIVLQTLGAEGNTEYLFQHLRRFENWEECVHPMYYDRGGGGEHHSVTGMGIKMYAAMEYQNRLLCNLADKAFAPKILFKPTTADAKQKLSVAHFGDYGVIPSGMEVTQTGIAGLLQDGLEFNAQVSNTIASNLSQYRLGREEKPGNPITATQAQIDNSQQAQLGKTQLSRYFEQLDAMYAEKFRRAANPNLTETNGGGKEALEFQKRCINRGVPKEALAKIDSVKATRVVGQGSPYMRQSALEYLMGNIALLPEHGRQMLIQDVIAARAGQSMVKRYFDVSPEAQLPTDQNATAMLQVAAMKEGVPPVVTDTQNPVIYAQTFLQAGAQAAQSLQQGGNPMEVSKFLDMVGAAIHAHLERIKNDPTRKGVYDALFEQWQQLAKIADQLKQKIQADMQKQQENQQLQQQAQQAQQGQDPKTQMAAAQLDNKMKLDSAKADHQMQLRQEKHNQDLALKDATTAATIHLQKEKQAAQPAPKE